MLSVTGHQLAARNSNLTATGRGSAVCPSEWDERSMNFKSKILRGNFGNVDDHRSLARSNK